MEIINVLGQIVVGAIITEHLLEGIHRNPLIITFKEHLLENTKNSPLLQEYFKCKFCESWMMGWFIAALILLWSGGCIADWVWMGIVMSWLSNRLHDLKHRILYPKSVPGGYTVTAKREES